MEKQFAVGIELGRKHLSAILMRGTKWQNRHIPIYIRENLLRPFYITERGPIEELHIIQMPVLEGEKVRFLLFAQRPRDEEPSQIPNLSQ
jgi:hypothetical protein